MAQISDDEILSFLSQEAGSTPPEKQAEDLGVKLDEDTAAVAEFLLSETAQKQAQETPDIGPALEYLNEAIQSQQPLPPRQFGIDGKLIPAPAGATKGESEDDWHAKFLDELKQDEGVSLVSRNDTKGIPTIGHGFNLTRPDAKEKIESMGYSFKDVMSGKQEISQDAADELLRSTATEAVKRARSTIPNFDKFSPAQQRALANMTFQMGHLGAAGFSKLLNSAAKMDVEGMVHEMADSKWMRTDTPRRAAAVTTRFIEGDVPSTVSPKGEAELKAVQPNIFDSLKDYVSETYHSLEFQKDYRLTDKLLEFFRKGARHSSLAPQFDENGVLTGYRPESPEEMAQREQTQRTARMRAAHVDSVSDAARITADVLNGISDPIGLLTGAKVAQGVGLFGRVARFAAMGGAYSAGVETLKQVNAATPLDAQDIAWATGMGAVAGGVGGELMVQAGRLVKYVFQEATSRVGSKLASSEAIRIVEQIENRVAAHRDNGLNPGQAFHRAMREVGLKFEDLPKTIANAGRRPIIEPSTYASFHPPAAVRDGGVMAKLPAGRFVDSLVGSLSTRIGNYSQALKGSIRRFDYAVQARTKEYSDAAEPFLRSLKALNRTDRNAINRALINEDALGAENLMRGLRDAKTRETLLGNFQKVRNILDRIYDDLTSAGVDVGYLPRFFPRLVKDYRALSAALPREHQSAITKIINKADEARAAANQPALSKTEKEGIINQYIRGTSAEKAIAMKPSITKGRTVETVDETLLPHYADAHTALANYIQYAAHTIEKAKLFGKNVDFSDATSPTARSFLSKWVRQEWENGNLTAWEMDDVIGLLAARFRGGEVDSSKFVRDIKNIFYIPTLGQVTSAATQIGDIGAAAYKNGVMNTLKALVPGLGRKIRPSDLGLDTAAAEMHSTGMTARMLDKVLKRTGFKAMDNLGKTALLTGSYRKLQNMVVTPRGARDFARKYGVQLGSTESTASAIKALQRGEINEDVKILLWNQLADMQPISLSEMPEKYLTVPNSRLFYMLKTWTLKQLDVMRRDIAQELAKGNLATGTKNLARYTSLMTVGGLGSAAVTTQMKNTWDYLHGRQGTYSTDIPDVAVSTLLKSFMLSPYIIEKVKQGKLNEAVGNLIAPPVNALGDVISDLAHFGQQFKTLHNAPGIGRVADYWFGGGLERELKKQRKAESSLYRMTDEELMQMLNEEREAARELR